MLPEIAFNLWAAASGALCAVTLAALFVSETKE